MNYEEAIQAINDGKRVTRLAWKDDYTFIFFRIQSING